MARMRKRTTHARSTPRTPTAPAATAPGSSNQSNGKSDQLQLARGAATPAMYDPKRRAQWGFSNRKNARDPYMIELNLRHPGGVIAAAAAFESELLPQVVSTRDAGKNKHATVRITREYFRCYLKVAEWRRLIRLDEQWEHDKRPSATREGQAWKRCIYRIWPDFKVKPLIDHSVATVKADAAMKSFSASGKEIVWAVIDSGVFAGHPHFGAARDKDNHRLLADDVADLHRDFTDASLANYDLDKQNALTALVDECGHGTHVAGIITGRAPTTPGSTVEVFERVFTPVSDTRHDVTQQPRWFDVNELRGVAPDCRIVSLKVLDAGGEGSSSNVIRALAYIREFVNTNPKMMRIHGVNLSVGYEFDAEMFACGQSPLCAEVDRLVQSGVVVVAAAGNTGYGAAVTVARATRIGISNSINDPGNAEHAITVGSTHRDAPHTYGISYFSSKGPTGDGRQKPDLVAPGERITSCAAGEKLAKLPSPAKPTKDAAARTRAAYLDDSGTSMAAPHVSGAIAAFLSIRREFIGRPDAIKRVFLESAMPLGRERYFEGRGLVDLMRAIQSV